jgi:hypothetical protein
MGFHRMCMRNFNEFIKSLQFITTFFRRLILVLKLSAKKIIHPTRIVNVDVDCLKTTAQLMKLLTLKAAHVL